MSCGGGCAADVIGGVTTLFFWGVGDVFVDWYLTFLIYLYLAFPLLYKAVARFRFAAVLIISLLVLCVVWNLPVEWYHESAFCRVPIFLVGIYLYVSKRKVRAILHLLAMFAALTMYSYFTGTVCLTYYLAPFMILAMFATVHYITKISYIDTILQFIGRHTLELYVANCIAMSILSIWQSNMPSAIQYIVYFTATICIAVMLFVYNKAVVHFGQMISMRKC